MNSKVADDLAKLFLKSQNLGINRSLLLHGRPGTGKSMIARSIVNQLQYRSLRINLQDLGQIPESTIVDALKTFKPDAIIFDDIDRAHVHDEMLTLIERVTKMCKLTLFTANDLNALSVAFRRPERIDMIMQIEHLDEDVIRAVLQEHQHLFDRVKTWPITYVQEARKLVKLFEGEELERHLKMLESRVEEGN